ncbi:hypothetical protein AGABI1DRAFT_69822 [Agaricus bisporus var. burnettii JB137-S8]|uniref:Peptide hydrolase n=1 Tax=Agaricus bisporus var. burnettii (strain JB137-S8 / ATCC MYA-4627 / FGSC 10392) TaxID=597362 RepID=K5XED1_AGABU|nr:uncharacterized protein AGABI1DRAFT_69822 [Agaricus bisporus var. burnettii JB137-S8]EKM81542.1 hypothetical protein AGABI1DRAFT_69822 [Agaricus bisporus var. burnettii JB137-S8]
MTVSWKWGPLRSLLALSPILIGVPLLSLRQHYTLPQPLVDLVDPTTQLPQISEANILGVAKYLSEDIGFRTVGTFEHALADTWMAQRAEEMQKECQRIISHTGRKLQCEVWHQRGSGSHRFDMMGKRLYKTYVDLTNVVIRISDGTPAGKEHALLVNSHVDSTLPSPGAADDGLAVGVMLDCMRVLINTPDWSPRHAIVLLFNHAEESLQDGSQLFSSQHPVASTVRAVINLEAAGTTGRELLFQATSEQMIEAYSHVPRPFGTVFASDIFSSGILLSDTDFRQFEYYLNVTGLDMAVVGNSYLYHMRKDLVENIQPGLAQHMGENTLALLRFLSSEESPLPNLTSGYTPPTTVYLTLAGRFFMYSFATAKMMYWAFFLASVLFVRLSATKNGEKASVAIGVMAVTVAFLGTIIVPNMVAFIMNKLLNKGMSWFSSPFAPVVLYGPPSILGVLLSQYLIGPISEQAIFNAMLLLQSTLALAIQMAGIGSASVFFLSGLPMLVALLINPLITGSTKTISLVAYALVQVEPLLVGTLILATVAEVFVPLTGRIGAQAPADHIVASIVSILGSQIIPALLPFIHRFERRKIWNGIVLSSIATAIVMAVFSMRRPFDEMHQKRLFVIHAENITTGEHHLHIAGADGAPGYELLVEDVTKEFSTADVLPKPIVMNDYNSDWDTLYPFSAFLTPYKVPLAVERSYKSPWVADQQFSVSAINDIRDTDAGTRSLTLEVKHPGLIWSVIAFDAHVLKWTLDNDPPDEHGRHFIKEASFYGIDTWSVDLVIKSPPNATDDETLLVNFIGLAEKGMWPGKKAVKAEGGPAMKLFEELDQWLDEKSGGTIDALFMSCVGGVTRL